MPRSATKLPAPFRVIAGAMGVAFCVFPLGMLVMLWTEASAPPLPIRLGGTVFLLTFMLIAALFPLRMAITGSWPLRGEAFARIARLARRAATPAECPSCGAPLRDPEGSEFSDDGAESLFVADVQCEHCGVRVPLRSPRERSRRRTGDAR